MESLLKWYNLFMIEDQKPENFRALRSITRLLVGGILLGSDALVGELQDWENDPEDLDSPRIEGRSQTQSQVDPLPDTLPAPPVNLSLKGNKSDVRYALIGLIFEGEENIERGFVAAKQFGNLALQVTSSILRPFQKLRVINPAQTSINRLVERGQSEVDRWVDRGRAEESHSRHLAQQAATSTVDQSISYMAHNPALEELIQQQSVSLAKQILEEVRSDAVSADYFFEGLVRYALRRKPRYLLPPPDPEVQEQAAWTLKDIRYEEL